ncbi:TIGD4 [Cordylochernes scorpioides]|uniref:TIGD4 n=1 Tax=Cordylochernes scorpioides TaxID=51811 RepID=A0ABY6K439_9ARAC|nr:TIGD4 [Cordylochernes scorpioides]
MPGHRKRRQFKQTDAFTRGMVIGLKRAGWFIRQIAAGTHLGASTVHRLWRRWLEQGNVAIYRNAGATRVTSARVDRRILRQAVAAPQATCTAILQHVQDTLDHSISTRTISRRLVANGLHSCRPLRRLPLTPPNRRQRLEWCRARSTWMTEWHRVVFSDESRFCLSSDSRRVRVWRRRGERSNPAAIVERPTVRQRGIMVWGAIAYDSRSPLLRIQGTMTAQRYVDDVLRPVTLPYLQGVPNALYQQDNARPHTARISQQALQDVQMLPWPPYSPELSPIEHVWDIIGRRLHALPQPRSEDELWQMVEREWRAIPQDAIRTLIDSLPRRVAACIAVRVEKKKKTDVAQKHNIPQSSLSTIIKNSEKIHQQALHAGESSRKRARGSTYADVDEALLQWFKQARSAALPVNGPLLSEKAKTLDLEFGLKDFTGSGGWIERWKARHGIKLRNICGESADVNRETMTNWLTDVMPNIISNYACKDIFNADETGLFWRLLPDKTLHFKGETCTGGKASKERITILLCCNMDGSEKMQPLVIGKAKQPRCFRGIKHLPVQYEANQKAWMTGLLFESWVRHIDKKMAGQHRQIILLLDNCGAHPPDMQGLTNTRIAFLPPNTTSMLQPCDQGIIRNFKMIYRTRLMRKYLTAYDAGTALTINLKQAVDIISVAWNDVLPATISNCWHNSGIIKSDVSSPLDTPQPATQMWEQQSLFDRMKEVLKIPLEMDFDSYADADNDVVTNAMLSDVEIVESILQAKEEEETDQVDEEVDPIVHIPHPKEVLESIQTLRLFLQCQDESKSLHRHLSDLDNIEKSVQHLLLTSKCQKKITNYFSKNT